MKKSHLYAGFLAPIVAFTGIVIAAYINHSWWTITDNAISDLGKLGLPHNWILDVSLITAGILGIYYATGLLEETKNRLESTGTWIFIVGLAFLATIGLFPEGTPPHYYVSWAFFLISATGIAVTGSGFLLSGRKELGLFTYALLAIGVPLAFWAKGHFVGVAVAESIGAITIAIWHYGVLVSIARKVQ